MMPKSSITVSRAEARMMAVTVANVAHYLAELGSHIRGLLSEGLEPDMDAYSTLDRRTYDTLVAAQETLVQSAEQLTPVKVFLAHLVAEAARAQALVKRTGGA